MNFIFSPLKFRVPAGNFKKWNGYYCYLALKDNLRILLVTSNLLRDQTRLTVFTCEFLCRKGLDFSNKFNEVSLRAEQMKKVSLLFLINRDSFLPK